MGINGYTYETLTGTITYNSSARAIVNKLTVDGVEYAVYYINATKVIYTVHYDDTNKKWVIDSYNTDSSFSTSSTANILYTKAKIDDIEYIIYIDTGYNIYAFYYDTTTSTFVFTKSLLKLSSNGSRKFIGSISVENK